MQTRTRLMEHALLIALWALSLPLQAFVARQMPFDHDFVPVVSLGWDWLMGGDFPAYGTLSSVTAYNMPMLIWLYLPAQIVTSHVGWAIFLTGVLLNLMGAWALLHWLGAMFGKGAGWVGATLFLFSEIAIAGSYTAWAQVQLPTLYALTSYAMWRWWRATTRDGSALWLALMGVGAFVSFMVHFASVMLFVALLIAGLLARARWTWRGLLAGGLICGALIAPYALFQLERDWVDVRAFLARESPIPQAELQAIQRDIYGGHTPAIDSPPAEVSPPADVSTPSRLERGLNLVLALPGQVWHGLVLPYWTPHLRHAIEGIFLLLGLGRALWGMGQSVRREGWRWLLAGWSETQAGRASLVVVIIVGFTLALSLMRNPPHQQLPYYYGTFVWHYALVAYGVMGVMAWLGRLPRAWLGRGIVVAWLIVGMSATVFERWQRIADWDETRHDAGNVWLYRHIEGVADAIAQAHEADSVFVVYDVLRYQTQLWWVVAWHQVDARYRAGMPFDYLLERYHGLVNHNQAGDGGVRQASGADFIVTTRIGAQAYLDDDAWGDARYFGGLVVLGRAD